MEFNTHFDLNGKHAFLSGSNYHWINYTPDKLEQVYANLKKKEEGTRLHDFASRAIKEKIRLAPLKKALNLFVNDAIGFAMESEKSLKYSYNCFGCADAISFNDEVLRIHDLKTGNGKVSFKQLDIYAAIFCLEYNYNPHDIQIEERIYQGRGYTISEPHPDDISEIMETIVLFDPIIERLKYLV